MRPLGVTGLVIDTPGMRSFGLAHIQPDDVLLTFADLAEASKDCPRGCGHMGPPADPEWPRWTPCPEQLCALSGTAVLRVAATRRLLATLGEHQPATFRVRRTPAGSLAITLIMRVSSHHKRYCVERTCRTYLRQSGAGILRQWEEGNELCGHDGVAAAVLKAIGNAQGALARLRTILSAGSRA
ncbi:hypothetical protein LRC484719_02870 [Mycobacterium riyadhense]